MMAEVTAVKMVAKMVVYLGEKLVGMTAGVMVVLMVDMKVVKMVA